MAVSAFAITFFRGQACGSLVFAALIAPGGLSLGAYAGGIGDGGVGGLGAGGKVNGSRHHQCPPIHDRVPLLG